MKRKLYSAILSAAVFATAADAYAQTNVYSVNVCTFVNLPIHDYRTWLIGSKSNFCRIEKYTTDTGWWELYTTRIHPDGTGVTTAVVTYKPPFQLWVSSWLAIPFSVLSLLGLFFYVLWRRTKARAA